MTDYIILAVVALIILAIVLFIRRKKKQSCIACIGCPHSDTCGKDGCSSVS